MIGGQIRYLRQRKRVVDFGGKSSDWDLFVSAYNDSVRVTRVYDLVPAKRKRWIVLPEYGYSADECPNLAGATWCSPGDNEAEVVTKIVHDIGPELLRTSRVCIDITGFMRPQILRLVTELASLGVKSTSMLYTEPEHYMRKEHTKFSDEAVLAVRQVLSFEGVHDDDMTSDVVIVGVGYDHALIARVIDDRGSAKLVRLLSLPSLSADMYQESILRLDRAGAAGESDAEHDDFFAPANDPFVVAAELSAKVAQLRRRKAISNLYLCPLATKPQVLGFALFYQAELIGTAASIIFPFANSYSRETATGRGRTWCYEVCF